MLMRSSVAPHAPRRVRQLWHDAERNAPSLGCITCPEKLLCGGVCVAAPYFDCLTYCCGNPKTCTAVCRSNAAFPTRVWEVDGFSLSNTPRGPLVQAPELPHVIPIIFHGSRRVEAVAPGIAALPLGTTFSRRSGEPRIGSAEALRTAYRLVPETEVMLTGIGEDEPIERWWGVGTKSRIAVIRAMRAAGVGIVTTPNFSLTLNAPRWDDLHAMKRIALVHAEFIGEGMPAALHVNGRTDRDFERWTEFIVAREEITHISYEFTTGPRWAGRRQQHSAWLCGLAANAGRPLHLIVRGGTVVFRQLARAFARVTVLETDSFMWTMKRQEAVLNGYASIRPRSSPTERGAPLDALLATNIIANRTAIENRLSARLADEAAGTV